jgi:hypothetical protein
MRVLVIVERVVAVESESWRLRTSYSPGQITSFTG